MPSIPEAPKRAKRSRFGPPKEKMTEAQLEELAAKLMDSAPAATTTAPPDYGDWKPGMDDGSTRLTAPVSLDGTPSGPVTKVFVASLSYAVREEHLRGLFGKYQSVGQVNVVMDRMDPTKSRGFAFVEFSNREEAERAVNEMNGALLMGRNIAAKISEEKKQAGGRPPDWDCPQCGATGVYGSKPNCFKCGAPNPGIPGAKQQDRGGFRGGNGGNSRPPDWDCAQCGATGCFGSKPTCFRCGAPNPNGGSGGSGGYQDRRGGRDRNDRRSGGGYNGGNDNYGGRNDRHGSGGSRDYGRSGGYSGGRDRDRDFNRY